MFKLSTVASSELLKLGRVVAVPLAQLCWRRNVLAPLVECRLGLAYPAWPDVIDQDPNTVLVVGLVVHPANAHIRCGCHRPTSSLTCAAGQMSGALGENHEAHHCSGCSSPSLTARPP